jgi:hypothetical protein
MITGGGGGGTKELSKKLKPNGTSNNKKLQ